jgi:hypothetical protein
MKTLALVVALLSLTGCYRYWQEQAKDPQFQEWYAEVQARENPPGYIRVVPLNGGIGEVWVLKVQPDPYQR